MRSLGATFDFLAGPRNVVEVKYRSKVDRRVLNGLRSAFPNRSVVVACKHEFAFLDNLTALIPVPLLMWALG
ncbi:MAG: hypothetical protein ACREN8_01505 [Candidatus Dormibacteraceae bacterium]